MASPPAPAPAQRIDRWLIGTLYPDGLRRIESGFAELAPLRPVGPHCYLAFVGVDPDAQSAGIGSTLLRPALAAADARGRTCYLETPFERTIPFYRRLGFAVERELPMTFGIGPLWTMIRPPSPADVPRGPAAH